MTGTGTAKAGSAQSDAQASAPSPNGHVKRKLKNQGKLLLRRIFEAGQHLGFDVLPRHFYSEIPDIRQLKSDRSWRAPYDMQGIRGDPDRQMEFMRDCTVSYQSQLAEKRVHQSAVSMNGSDEGYGEIEADFLYCFVRRQRPATIIQIGCGVSTAVCLLASRDEGYKPHIICIEPYPTQFLQKMHQSGEIELVRQKAQEVDFQFFNRLNAGDLFFIDSSHTLGPGGEVSRIILSILPRLQTGVYVHFHDIWFPYDYCPHVLSSDLFFLHETPLLYAFLCMNSRYEIAASLCQLFHTRQDELRQCLPRLVPARFDDGLMIEPGHHPSSIYLRA
jgi:hypothetical protein